ncbi:hypothetical protein SCUCBS95973_007752 [Sporothrix curviconia]|uniref:Acyl-CoA dehydrogenase n=1 Tax=Sporothrix curviconia TaxID=1260050 RepID=A0ABP0CGD2_9PEZI
MKDFGGSALGISEAAVMLQTIAESGACMNGASSVHMNIFGLEPVAKFGMAAQKERWLPPLIQGQERACFGVTEPNTGLDTLKLQSTARREGDYYIAKGYKVFISTAQMAQKILLLARTTPIEEVDKPSCRLSLFYTDLNRDAVQITYIPKMGRSAVDTNALFFEDWTIPAEDLVGGFNAEGDGFKMILHGINAERVLMAAEALGIGFAALRRVSQYAGERMVFNKPINTYQSIQHPLTECWIQLESARLVVYLAVRMYDEGYAGGEYANAAKFLASEAAFKTAERAIRTHGNIGYAKKYHIERYLRKATLSRIAPVSAEMIKNYIRLRRSILRGFHKQAVAEAVKAREIEEDVILALTGLRTDLSQKIKKIKNISGDFRNNVDKEMDATKKAVKNLQDNLGQAELDSSAPPQTSDRECHTRQASHVGTLYQAV